MNYSLAAVIRFLFSEHQKWNDCHKAAEEIDLLEFLIVHIGVIKMETGHRSRNNTDKLRYKGGPF